MFILSASILSRFIPDLEGEHLRLNTGLLQILSMGKDVIIWYTDLQWISHISFSQTQPFGGTKNQSRGLSTSWCTIFPALHPLLPIVNLGRITSSQALSSLRCSLFLVHLYYLAFCPLSVFHKHIEISFLLIPSAVYIFFICLISF